MERLCISVVIHRPLQLISAEAIIAGLVHLLLFLDAVRRVVTCVAVASGAGDSMDIVVPKLALA